MPNERIYIKNEALGLEVGASTQVYCPCCDNDPPYPPSLSITRDDNGIIYNCFRAVCSCRGFIGSLPSCIPTDKKLVKRFVPKPYTREATLPNAKIQGLLSRLYGITEEELRDNGIKQTGTGGLLMPLYNVEGYPFGHTTKYRGKALKAIHYLTTETSKLHFVNPRRVGSSAILVEDVLSAIRVHRFAQGVALLGTNLNIAMVKDLLKGGYRDIIVALDPDALHKAIKMRKAFGIFFTTFRIVSLSNDPKDLSDKQLRKEMNYE